MFCIEYVAFSPDGQYPLQTLAGFLIVHGVPHVLEGRPKNVAKLLAELRPLLPAVLDHIIGQENERQLPTVLGCVPIKWKKKFSQQYE